MTVEAERPLTGMATSRLAPSFLPDTAVLEMTYRCNHQCLFCSCPWEGPSGAPSAMPRGEELSVTEWKETITALCRMGCTNLAFTGGEALLKDGIFDIIEHAAGCQAEHITVRDGAFSSNTGPPNLQLLSNGTTVTPDVLRFCRDYDVQLSMSLPGLATLREHTGCGNPDTILAVFQAAHAMNLQTVVNVTTTRRNLPELYETIAAAFLAGASRLLLNRFLPGGRGLLHADVLALDTAGVRRMLDTAEEALLAADRYGSVGTELPRCVFDATHYTRLAVGTACGAAISFFVVGPDGYTRVCNHSPVPLVHVGNIYALKDHPYWRTFTQRAHLPRACRNCSSVALCDGGCREAAHLVGGAVDSPDPLLMPAVQAGGDILVVKNGPQRRSSVAGMRRVARRIGIGGIAIESCTFSPLLSTLDDFAVLRGDALSGRYPFLPAWRWQSRDDLEWRPTLQAKAIPGGPVRRGDYDGLKRELLQRLEEALPLDAFYLDLHGAMNVVGLDDAEADLVAAVRARLGPDALIAASLDLHANVSAELVALVDIFAAYRTAPHVDVRETREKACRLLVECLDHGVHPCRAWARIPVILSGEQTGTDAEPARTLYARLRESDAVPGVLDASLLVGYVWADEPRTAASAVVTARDAATARREVRRIAERYRDAYGAFRFVAPAAPADTCIQWALADGGTSIFISDSGDNPTGGGAGDVPFLLERLLACESFASGARTAIYAGMADAAAVRACAAAGIGARVALQVGGKLDPVHGAPLPLDATVTGVFPDDPVGGDLAVVRLGGIHVVLTSRRKPFHFVRELLRLGLDPARANVTVIKIGYLEPDLARAARKAFLALTPGAVNQDITALDYHRVRRPIFPLDPVPGPVEVRVFGAVR